MDAVRAMPPVPAPAIGDMRMEHPGTGCWSPA